MSEKISTKMYGGFVELTFNPNNHRYSVKHTEPLSEPNKYLPSVTAVTSLIDKSRPLMLWAVNLTGTYIKQWLEEHAGPYNREELLLLVQEATRQHELIRDKAASIGSQVHAYAEAFGKAVIAKQDVPAIPEDITDERIRAGINAFLTWFVENDVQFIHTELPIYSLKHGYVGITDLIANVNGKRTLVDYKTGNGIYPEARVQAAAYQFAFEEESDSEIEQRMIVNFSKDTGKFETLTLDNQEEYEKDMQAFVGLLAAKRRLKELEK